MSCPSFDNQLRSEHWRTTNWNCPQSSSPEHCNSNEQQVKINYTAGGWGNGCGIFGDKNQYVCSSPYDISTDKLWECCSGSKSAYKCDPSYCVNSSSCSQFLQSNCTAPDLYESSNSNKSKSCNDWCIKNPDSCNVIQKEYCSNISNLSNPGCQQYARENGGLDNVVKQYCETHTSDAFCSCQNTLTNYKAGNSQLQILNNPVCFGDQCPINGYRTSEQRAFKCPTSLNICNNSISTAGETTSYLSTLANSCSTSSTSASNSGTPNLILSSNSSSNTSLNNYSIFNLSVEKQLLFLFVLLLSIIFGVNFFMSKKKQNISMTTHNIM